MLKIYIRLKISIMLRFIIRSLRKMLFILHIVTIVFKMRRMRHRVHIVFLTIIGITIIGLAIFLYKKKLSTVL